MDVPISGVLQLSDTQGAFATGGLDRRWHRHVSESLAGMIAQILFVQQGGTAYYPGGMLAHLRVQFPSRLAALPSRLPRPPSLPHPEDSSSAHHLGLLTFGLDVSGQSVNSRIFKL